MTAGLNIAALARRTGVAPDTLRKWEQRYAILQPSRTAGGQRRYSERDVARVEWLRERLGEGYRIGEAATLLGTAVVQPARSSREQLNGILGSLDSEDATGIGQRLDQAFALIGVERTLDEIVRPLLEAVDERGIAAEHLVSEAVRSRLGHLLSDTSGGVRGIAVLACAPGERHELGLMMTAIAMRRDGWKVVYLGADTPLAAAFECARTLKARLVGISVGTQASADALERSSTATRRPAGVSLVLGGGAASAALGARLGAVQGGLEAVRTLSA